MLNETRRTTVIRLGRCGGSAGAVVAARVGLRVWVSVDGEAKKPVLPARGEPGVIDGHREMTT
jgi:hypothetical protein